MHDLLETVAGAGVDGGQTPPAEAWSARAWFASGERIGYTPRSRAIVAREDAPLRSSTLFSGASGNRRPQHSAAVRQ